MAYRYRSRYISSYIVSYCLFPRLRALPDSPVSLVPQYLTHVCLTAEVTGTSPDTTIDTNGWGIIAGATQSGLNKQLAMLRDNWKHIKKTGLEISGLPIPADLDLVLGSPQIQLKDGPGHRITVLGYQGGRRLRSPTW